MEQEKLVTKILDWDDIPIKTYEDGRPVTPVAETDVQLSIAGDATVLDVECEPFDFHLEDLIEPKWQSEDWFLEEMERLLSQGDDSVLPVGVKEGCCALTTEVIRHPTLVDPRTRTPPANEPRRILELERFPGYPIQSRDGMEQTAGPAQPTRRHPSGKLARKKRRQLRKTLKRGPVCAVRE